MQKPPLHQEIKQRLIPKLSAVLLKEAGRWTVPLQRFLHEELYRIESLTCVTGHAGQARPLLPLQQQLRSKDGT